MLAGGLVFSYSYPFHTCYIKYLTCTISCIRAFRTGIPAKCRTVIFSSVDIDKITFQPDIIATSDIFHFLPYPVIGRNDVIIRRLTHDTQFTACNSQFLRCVHSPVIPSVALPPVEVNFFIFFPQPSPMQEQGLSEIMPFPIRSPCNHAY